MYDTEIVKAVEALRKALEPAKNIPQYIKLGSLRSRVKDLLIVWDNQLALSAPTATASTLGEPADGAAGELSELLDLSKNVALPLVSNWDGQQYTLSDANHYQILEDSYACTHSEIARLSEIADTSIQDYLREAANALPGLIARLRAAKAAHPTPTVAARGAAETGGDKQVYPPSWNVGNLKELAKWAKQGDGAAIRCALRVMIADWEDANQSPAAPTEATRHRESPDGH